jgi:hypothetical protein
MAERDGNQEALDASGEDSRDLAPERRRAVERSKFARILEKYPRLPASQGIMSDRLVEASFPKTRKP